MSYFVKCESHKDFLDISGPKETMNVSSEYVEKVCYFDKKCIQEKPRSK